MNALKKAFQGLGLYKWLPPHKWEVLSCHLNVLISGSSPTARNNTSVVASYDCIVRPAALIAFLELLWLLGASRKSRIICYKSKQLQLCVEQTCNSHCSWSCVIPALSIVINPASLWSKPVLSNPWISPVLFSVLWKHSKYPCGLHWLCILVVMKLP